MSDEAALRSGRKDHSRNAQGERGGELSPLQGRASFIKNWSWELVTHLNRGSCERGKAQHGNNPQTSTEVRQKWEATRGRELSLGELLDFLRECHRSAPFLFFNGNTFGEIARRVVDVIFAEFPTSRRREAASLAAHYVAGVLDRDLMESGLITLGQLAQFKVGDKVKTFRGSSRGVVVRILDDGRIVWRAGGRKLELIALPESLIRD